MHSEKLQIRQASLADIDEITVLFDGYRQFYGQERNLHAARQFLLDRMDRGESVIFIAEADGKAIGFTQLYRSFSSVSLGRIYILNDLFVRQDGRGRGAGAGLLAAAVSYARSLGAIRLALSTACTNIKAQGLYEVQGWVRDDDFFYTYQLVSKNDVLIAS